MTEKTYTVELTETEINLLLRELANVFGSGEMAIDDYVRSVRKVSEAMSEGGSGCFR